jgi:hypothetical protein
MINVLDKKLIISQPYTKVFATNKKTKVGKNED